MVFQMLQFIGLHELGQNVLLRNIYAQFNQYLDGSDSMGSHGDDEPEVCMFAWLGRSIRSGVAGLCWVNLDWALDGRGFVGLLVHWTVGWYGAAGCFIGSLGWYGLGVGLGFCFPYCARCTKALSVQLALGLLGR